MPNDVDRNPDGEIISAPNTWFMIVERPVNGSTVFIKPATVEAVPADAESPSGTVDVQRG